MEPAPVVPMPVLERYGVRSHRGLQGITAEQVAGIVPQVICWPVCACEVQLVHNVCRYKGLQEGPSPS